MRGRSQRTLTMHGRSCLDRLVVHDVVTTGDSIPWKLELIEVADMSLSARNGPGKQQAQNNPLHQLTTGLSPVVKGRAFGH